MSLRVSTTGSDVTLTDLGIEVIHPTVSRDLSLEFTAVELRNSTDLTTAIQAGDLDVDDGTYFIHQDDYDPDALLIQELGYNKDELYVSHDELLSKEDILINKTGVFPLSLNSTAASTRNIYSPAARFITWQLETGDIVSVSGSTAADGLYTVESVTDQQNFIVEESILDSTGGTVSIYHPAGSTRIGVDSSTLDYSDGETLQEVLEDLNTVSGIAGLSVSGHSELDQLVHNIAEDSYEEVSYNGIWPTTAIIYTNENKTTKIREEQYTWSGIKLTNLITIQYDSNGTEVERVEETYTYSGIKVVSIDREFI